MSANCVSGSPFFERRLLRWLLIFYCLFILYGSFIPFSFSSDPAFLHSQRLRFFKPPYLGGVKTFSTLDVVANILLFVPFGFSWVGGQVSGRLNGRLAVAAGVTGVAGLALGFFIEIGQLFSPGRTASLLDVACNGLGATLGGAAAYFIFRGLRGAFGNILLGLVRQRPRLILLCLLLLVAMVDAFYPFHIGFDVSTIGDSLKRARWVPFHGAWHRFWGDLLVEKVFLFAAIGYLSSDNLPPAYVNRRRPLAWGLCTLFALCVEAGKLFFLGRAPNADNAVLSSFGALCGVLIVAPLAHLAMIRRYGVEVSAGILMGLIFYAELAPFDWIASAQELPARIAGIEWLPLRAYYGADPQSAVFDLAKKLMLLGPLGFCLAARKPRAAPARQRSIAAVTGVILGVFLEAAQILLRSRTPSVTDVALFALTAWAGALVFERYWKIKNA